MGMFSTRNHDGGSVLAEPTSTIPLKERAKLAKEADRHGCDTIAEFVSAPSVRHGEYSPDRAVTN
jgi:hypothetical protein